MPYFAQVISIVNEPLIDCCVPSLATTVIIPDKVFTVLVDGIVCQVHTLLVL